MRAGLFKAFRGRRKSRQGKAGRLHAVAAGLADAMDSISWRDFEILAGEYFRRQGFSMMDRNAGGLQDVTVPARLRRCGYPGLRRFHDLPCSSMRADTE